MIAVKVIPKKWGNSIGIRIPKDKIHDAGLEVGKEATIWLSDTMGISASKLWGSLEGKKGLDAQRVKDESRKIWDL